MAKYDDMSFGRAFAAARREKGKGKTFTWKGKSYSTNRADDAPSSNSRSSSEDSFVARNRQAIERAEAERAPAVRPRARPTERPKVRPRARDNATSPTSTNASSPRVTTTALEPAVPGRSGRTSRPPEGPRASGRRNLANVTLADWAKMSPAERKELGLPNNRGAARRMLEGESNSTSNRRSRPGGSAARGMSKGGMVKKAGYAKGGMIKANCGASMKPTQKGTKE